MEAFKRAEVSVGGNRLEGNLFLPKQPVGLIIVAQGSGSPRFSPRKVFVAESLVARGFEADARMSGFSPALWPKDRRSRSLA